MNGIWGSSKTYTTNIPCISSVTHCRPACWVIVLAPVGFIEIELASQEMRVTLHRFLIHISWPPVDSSGNILIWVPSISILYTAQIFICIHILYSISKDIYSDNNLFSLRSALNFTLIARPLLNILPKCCSWSGCTPAKNKSAERCIFNIGLVASDFKLKLRKKNSYSACPCPEKYTFFF